MNSVINIIIFIVGLFLGNLFNYIGSRLSNDKNFIYTSCKECNNKKSIFTISLIDYVLNLGRCKKCLSKASILPVLYELLTGVVFVFTYHAFLNSDPKIIILLYSFLFISSLLIIFISDIKYMIIPDEILIFFTIILVFLKIYLAFYNEEIKNFMDVCYEIIFFLYNGLFMFLVIYIIKKIGDKITKKDSLGYGDVKMMFYISMLMGWKISLFIVFFASFLSLPVCTYQLYKDDRKVMIAFGPYLALSTIIVYLLKIDITELLSYIM